MNNVIDALNVLVNGVNLAFSRGAYNMKETHDLHDAIEFIKQAVGTQQEQKETTPPVDQTSKTQPTTTTTTQVGNLNNPNKKD